MYKLSKPFARNADDHLQICLDERNNPVLVTDEFLQDAINVVDWDASAVVKCEPRRTREYQIVPNADDAAAVTATVQPFKILLHRLIIDGRYQVWVGWVEKDGRRYIVSDGELRKIDLTA